jgi:hypothetical protein
MHEYGHSFNEVRKFTMPQLHLFQRKIKVRKTIQDEYEAKLHGFKLKKDGLDIEGCVPIEDILPSGGLKM